MKVDNLVDKLGQHELPSYKYPQNKKKSLYIGISYYGFCD